MYSRHTGPCSLSQRYQIVDSVTWPLAANKLLLNTHQHRGGHLRRWWHNCNSPVITGDYQRHLVSWRLPANRRAHTCFLNQSWFSAGHSHTDWYFQMGGTAGTFLTVFSQFIHMLHHRKKIAKTLEIKGMVSNFYTFIQNLWKWQLAMSSDFLESLVKLHILTILCFSFCTELDIVCKLVQILFAGSCCCWTDSGWSFSPTSSLYVIIK